MSLHMNPFYIHLDTLNGFSSYEEPDEDSFNSRPLESRTVSIQEHYKRVLDKKKQFPGFGAVAHLPKFVQMTYQPDEKRDEKTLPELEVDFLLVDSRYFGHLPSFSELRKNFYFEDSDVEELLAGGSSFRLYKGKNRRGPGFDYTIVRANDTQRLDSILETFPYLESLFIRN